MSRPPQHPTASLRGITAGVGLRAWLALVGCVAGAVGHAAAIDGPRPANAVVDATGILGQDDVDRLERLAAGVRQASGADMMVVLIPTTAGRAHRGFATDLFNRWRLGSAERDDGLLIFVALDDRKAEIILGDGVDEPAQVAASQRIMSEVMIPEFKRGRPAEGLRKAAFACAAEILGAGGEDRQPDAVDPGQAEPVMAEAPAHVRRPVNLGPPAEDDMLPRAIPYALGGSGAVGGLGVSWYYLRRHLRNRPRTCPSCRIDMVRLGELADDAQLTGGQRMEERLRSVDYDVWTCPTCPEVMKLRYGAFFTKYARCPKCGYATKSRTVRRIVSPTSYSSGLETVTERCDQCGYSAESTRVLPQLGDSSSSSSWSSSSGGSSGGGHSSGSGASGSW